MTAATEYLRYVAEHPLDFTPYTERRTNRPRRQSDRLAVTLVERSKAWPDWSQAVARRAR